MVPLFLLGAPKCATTSLYEHLAGHPQMIAPSLKEPGYFTREEVRADVQARTPHLRNFQKYLELYDAEEPGKRAWCDGSTSYLRSPEALAEIRSAFPRARAVAVVRDPVELVSSYYTFLRHERWENASSLDEAWALQASRQLGENVPPAANRPDSLLYGKVAMLGEQVRRARRAFGADLLIYTLEDLRKDFSTVSLSVQRLAGLDPLNLGDLPRANAAREARLSFVNRLVKDPPAPVALFRDKLKASMGLHSLGIRRRIEAVNSQRVRREISADLQSKLRSYFKSDVAVLSDEIGRDLEREWGW